MTQHPLEPIAIVGLAAIMPDALDAPAFWDNIKAGKYSISDVPPERWDPALYYDADRSAVDKTYSRIGGWVRDYPWDPRAWRLPLPPKVADQMDHGQKWALSAARAALVDAGWPDWDVDPEQVAVILGNAIGGEKHYATNLRISLPEVLRELEAAPTFAALPENARRAIVDETQKAYRANFVEINEDTMPGELANVTAGRIANLFNFRGPNFTTDAACASGLAGMWAAAQGLVSRQYDVAVSGGVDRNMGVTSFVKFCKIGALSATGTRPFDAGADGFVMGEGAALFVMKRLADAERAGDRIYAVLLGMAGSSDGKGKGITAPNPAGQRLAIARAWEQAGVDPSAASAVEAHGTSTSVGDAAELESLTSVFGPAGAAPGSIALGSVKSNIGHLKAAAGTAGLLKMALSLHEKVLAPSLNFNDPNPKIDWATSPFRVNTELRDWPVPPNGVRIGAVSAFGFGGTNFHAVLEEYVPGRHTSDERRSFAGADVPQASVAAEPPKAAVEPPKAAVAPPKAVVVPEPPKAAVAPPKAVVVPEPPKAAVVSQPPKAAVAPEPAEARRALVIGGSSDEDVVTQLDRVHADALAGQVPPAPDLEVTLRATVRLAIDYADAAELATKADKARKAFAAGNPAMWRLLKAQGVFLGRGPAPKVAFLYTGQGSQYVNMLRSLRESEPIVAETFAEADRIMEPLLGRTLSSYIFIDGEDPKAVAQLEQQLLQTEITQPAVLTSDAALTRMLAAHGVKPDMVMGHSLGEYGALVAAGAMDFSSALEAVSARGMGMAHLSIDDNGAMAAVFGPLPEIERIVAEFDGYVVVANVNSNSQAVIGGATKAVEQIIETFQAAGLTAKRIPVSHAFHTSIVAPASEPLREVLRRLDVHAPTLPIVANITGEFYPADASAEAMVDILARQVASPVQFVKGLHTLYDAGARVFVEVGPKKALHGFVEDVFAEHDDVLALFTNHPKLRDATAFNQALCGLYAAGFGLAESAPPRANGAVKASAAAPAAVAPAVTPVTAQIPAPIIQTAAAATNGTRTNMNTDKYVELGKVFADFLEQGRRIYDADAAPAPRPDRLPKDEPVVVTGAALGLPGVERVFDDENIGRILAGEQFIGAIPHDLRQAMVDKHITRLVKPESGEPSFVSIDDEAGVIKLAGRSAPLDVVSEFGVKDSLNVALDDVTRLAIGAGFDALRDAGIPLVMRYRTTTIGTQLPDRWGLPDELRDDTGIVFASAFPGYGEFGKDVERYSQYRGRRHELAALQAVRAKMRDDESATAEVDRRIAELEQLLETEPFTFDRRFVFRCLAMGHSQFAELIGARGPNTQINAACASTTQALCVAEDWIRTGRARRVVVIAADDVTSDTLLPWIGSGFLASGAAATDEAVEDAATPFDRRRHGMIVGMGAASIVVESADAARERGIQPICEVLGAVTANSAFHGTRLDVSHVSLVMEKLLTQVESRGFDRYVMAPSTMFVSHETYTPARGGSAAAEISALRSTFGSSADQVVITNTKGFTGHAMGAGIEDVVAIKALETGIVPPVPNFKEPDPELGTLNLSVGGAYPAEYALRLAAGFGSQVAMAMLRWTPMPDRQRRSPDQLGFAYRIADPAVWQAWLSRISGQPEVDLEVVQHRLRVVDKLAPKSAPVPAAATNGAARPTMASPAPVAEVPVAVPEPVMVAAPVVAAPVVAAPAVAAPVVEAPAVEAPVVAAPAVAAPAVVKDEPVHPHASMILGDEVGVVVSIVSELTGYPPELLDLDLDMEADLGVDTVKQAEVFAAVREHYGVERDENLQLRDFPTLNHVVGWVADKTASNGAAPAAAPVGPATPAAQPQPEPEPQPVARGDRRAEMVEVVVSIVSELTGYPPELLDLDLDMEADLGVDTVKQAEVFAAVREHFGVERDENLQLRDFPTLNHVVGWISDKTEASAPVAAAPAAAAPAAPPAAAPVAEAQPVVTGDRRDEMVEVVVSIVSELTGYPTELLDLDLDMEADLGVDTVKQAEVFAAVREHFGVERDENLQLRDFPTLNHVVGWISDKTAASAPTAAPTVAPAEPAVAAPAAPTVTAPAAPPVTEPVPAPAAEAQPVVTGDRRDEMVEVVVSIVSELTGYPAELLDLDLDMEADLGVDTVKQAEVFAAVRERFGVERDENLQLRDFPTLNHVVGWISEKVGSLPKAGEPAVEIVPTGSTEAEAVPSDLAATDAYPRRVPTPVLRPSLDLCKPTGVSLDGTSRVIVMADEGGVGAGLAQRLTKQGSQVLVLDAGVNAEPLAATLDAWLAAGPVTGVFWLAALDDEGPVEAMDLAAWHEALNRRVKNLYVTMHRLFEAKPFLVAATRLGGYHGYDESGATAPLGGAVSGFAKAYHRELPDVLVKVVDVPLGRDANAVADALVAETLRDPGCTEVGYPDDGLRWSVGLADAPFGLVADGMTLDAKSVFVVTGAAGSIVSAITADLAKASGGTFHLLDLTPAPDPSDPDLARFSADKTGLKSDIAARLKQNGQRPTPVLIEKELARIERVVSAYAAIQAVTEAGGTARYHQVDLTDADAVARVMAEVRNTSGRVDVLLHAAGLEISRSLRDKEQREFDLVFGVKSDGWFNVLHAIGDMPLGATVAFSSVAGRFGNVGQTDYSAANDLLCKLTSNLRRTRRGTRSIALDWTAWAGIGMATRGSIPKVMELAGIQTLAPEAGIAWVRRELISGTDPREVLVAGSLGFMAEEPDETGGVAAGPIAGGGPMLGTVESTSLSGGIVVRTTLDPKRQPFLNDHRIDGTPVLPGVMGIEAFVEVAGLLAPGWSVAAVEDVEFLAPVKFYRDEPRTLTIHANVSRDGSDLLAHCLLEGERLLPGSAEPQKTTHFTGTVRLTKKTPSPEHVEAIAEQTPTVAKQSVYELYFHGPAYQVVSSAWRYNGGNAARMTDGLPDDHVPMAAPTLAGPRLVELCFQTAGLWEAAQHGRFALPQHVDKVRLLRDPAQVSGALYAVATEVDDHFDCSVRDAAGDVILTVEGYRTSPLPVAVREDIRRGLGFVP